MNKILFKLFTFTFIFVYGPTNAQASTQLLQKTSPASYLQKIKQSTPAIFLTQQTKNFMQKPCIQKTLSASQNFACAATDWRTYYTFATQHRKKIVVVSSGALAAYGVYSFISYWRAHVRQAQHVEALVKGYRANYICYEQEIKPYHERFIKSLFNNLYNYYKLKNLDLPSDTSLQEVATKVTKKFHLAICTTKKSVVLALIKNTKAEDASYIFTLEELENPESSKKIRTTKFFKSHLFEALKEAIKELNESTKTESEIKE